MDIIILFQNFVLYLFLLVKCNILLLKVVRSK